VTCRAGSTIILMIPAEAAVAAKADEK